MRIKVIASKPIDGQDQIANIIGKEYQTLNLKKIYDTEIVKEMKTSGEIAIYAEDNDRHPTILNKDEYEILPD